MLAKQPADRVGMRIGAGAARPPRCCRDAVWSSAYFGEAEVIAARLRQQLAESDFEAAICFFGKNLTKAHAKYLEAKLIRLAHKANTSLIENACNRYSQRKILIQDKSLSDMRFTGTVFTASVDDWLKAVQQAYPVRVEQTDSGDILLKQTH